MEVRCIQPCWDSKRCQKFFNGNLLSIKADEVNKAAMDPIAKYFEGWPGEIPVYAKEKGIEGYKMGGVGKFIAGEYAEDKPIVKESVEPKVSEGKAAAYKMCDWCGKKQINLGAHKVHCKARPKPVEEKPEQ